MNQRIVPAKEWFTKYFEEHEGDSVHKAIKKAKQARIIFTNPDVVGEIRMNVRSKKLAELNGKIIQPPQSLRPIVFNFTTPPPTQELPESPMEEKPLASPQEASCSLQLPQSQPQLPPPTPIRAEPTLLEKMTFRAIDLVDEDPLQSCRDIQNTLISEFNGDKLADRVILDLLRVERERLNLPHSKRNGSPIFRGMPTTPVAAVPPQKGTPEPRVAHQGPVPHCYQDAPVEDRRLVTWFAERSAGLSEECHHSQEIGKDCLSDLISSLLDKGVNPEAITIWTPRKFKAKKQWTIEIE